MIDSRFLNSRHYITAPWDLAAELSGISQDDLSRLSWEIIFEAHISPALPHKITGVHSQWETLRSSEAASNFSGAWTARMVSMFSPDLVLHFEVEEDAVIARLIIGSA